MAKTHFLCALVSVFSSICFAQENDNQIIVGFEKTISRPGEPELKLITETIYPQTPEQLTSAHKYVEAEALKALEANSQLKIEYVQADYHNGGLPSVQPLNHTSVEELEATRKALGITDILVSPSAGRPIDDGLKELLAHRQVVATRVTLPTPLADRDVIEEGTSQATEAKDGRLMNRTLTIVRSVSALGINGFMIYSTIGADMLTPLVVPALLFYPALELGFQKMSDKYVRLLKSFKNIYARAGFRTAISFACIAVHVGLLSSIGVAEFSLLAVTASSIKAALLTHSWWELVVDPKSKLFSGKYVSFGLGIIGMTGLLLESMGYNIGSYILYGLGVSGGVMWERKGAWALLKSDTLKAAEYFKSKAGNVAKYFQSSCESLSRNFLKRIFNE